MRMTAWAVWNTDKQGCEDWVFPCWGLLFLQLLLYTVAKVSVGSEP